MRSILFAFAMFTRLPMPRLEWTGKNMRFIMAAFPAVGVFIGAAAYLWLALAEALRFGGFLTGVGFALVPVLMTGGIHMDGFCDTVDALASHGDREKKLRILKDPHIGPFASFTGAAYLMAFAALASEIDAVARALWCFPLLFVLSRTLVGMAVVLCPTAKGSSLGKTFHDAAAKRISMAVLGLFFAIAVFLFAWCGGRVGVAAALCSFVTAVLCLYKTFREFGGLGGDASGWTILICEAACLCVLVIGFRLTGF